MSEPSESTRDMVRQLVEAVRDEPGLLGYYLADEPEISDTRSDYLEAFYALLQELDPYHPVMITNDTLDGIVTHGYKACDILNPDPYSPAWDYVPNFMKKAAGTGARGKALMTTLWHAAGHGNFNMPWGSAPPYPYRVMRSQYLASVALGSRGFTAYIDPFFLAEPVLRWGLPPIWREVRFLEPAMAQPAEPVTVTASAEAAVWLRRVAGQAYLIVVNHKPGERAIAVQSPALQGVERLLVVGEGREVVLRDGGFTETFAEGDARIYTTDPAGRELALTAEVERDIAAHEAAAIAPGNLLHLSRGVRAKASGGFYAPWLEQFYYYAINGLRDDLGWYLTHAGGQPASLELTLPEAAGIGQVVVYTPNLADFDLQFTGPDGAIRVAEVRQNAEDPVRVRFDPPLPTLKLRLTALAVRDGASPQAAQVPEIEAYAEAGEGPVTPVREEAGAVAPDFVAPARETAGPLTLWREDFTAFEHRDAFRWDGTDPWVFNPTTLRTEPQPGGGLKLIGLGRGTPSMARYWPYESDYRWFQVDLAAIEGGGYQFTTVNLTDGSGQPGFRVALNTSRPGLYTIDTWAQHPSFADGSLTQCFTPVYTVGGGLDAAEQPLPGTQFTYRLLQLARRPVNGLTVTMADGAPLPDTLRPGDELLFRVLLDEPAADATVEVLTGSSYQSLRLTDQPGIQLARVGDRDGREWAAQVRLADDVGKYDGRQGYPVLFHAALTGGPLAETWSAAQVRFGE